MARHRPPTFSRDLDDVLAGPLIHRLAADLQPLFQRRRRHPVAFHLGYLALQRAIGSANRLDAEFAAPGVWCRAIASYNRGARTYGDGRTVTPHTPRLTADTFRHLRESLTAPDVLPTVSEQLTIRSIEVAIAAGLLPRTGGSITHPDARRVLYGDGTIVRPLYRPDTPGRSDPDIGQHHRHDGAHWGNNFVLAYCRGPEPHRRVILGIDRVDQPGREADTAVEVFQRIISHTGGRVQAVVYDGAFRGVHHNTLMQQNGVVVITKVHAAARRNGEKTFRTVTLGVREHDPDGQTCSHNLVASDGAVHDAALDAAGQLQLSEPLIRKQVRRSHSRTNGYRFALGVTVACPRGPWTVWFSVHPHADYLRLLPETDPDFAALYGLRNDAESNNNSYKRTLPGRRAAALGWRRQLLDVAGWAILVNSRAHARYTPPAPEPPASTDVDTDPLDRLLPPADHKEDRAPSAGAPHTPSHAAARLMQRLYRTLHRRTTPARVRRTRDRH